PSDLKIAIEDLREVLRQEPNSRAGLFYMAEANFRLGQVDQARVFAGDLERNYPDYLPAKLMQVQIDLASGDAKGTMQLAAQLQDRLDKAAPDRDTSPQMLSEIKAKTLIAHGSAALQLRDTKTARKDFLAAHDIAPSSPEIDANYLAAYSALAALFVNTNQQQRAIEEYQKIVQRQPENAAIYTLIGMLEMNQQNIDAAIDNYRKALSQDSNAVFAANNLAWLYALYGKGNL